MNATVRSFSALLVVLALVAGMPAVCACAPDPSRQSSGDGSHEHDCCAPPVGVSAATAHDCCGGITASVEAVTAAAPAQDAPPAALRPFRFDTVSPPLPAPDRAVPAAPPPPRLVLRI